MIAMVLDGRVFTWAEISQSKGAVSNKAASKVLKEFREQAKGPREKGLFTVLTESRDITDGGVGSPAGIKFDWQSYLARRPDGETLVAGGIYKVELRFLTTIDPATAMRRLDIILHRVHPTHPHVRMHPHSAKLGSSGRDEAKPVSGHLCHWLGEVPAEEVPEELGVAVSHAASSADPGQSQSFYPGAVAKPDAEDCSETPMPDTAPGRMAGPPPGLTQQPVLPRSIYYMQASARQEFPQHDYVGRANAIVWLGRSRDSFVAGLGPRRLEITSGAAFPWHRYLLSSPKLQAILQREVANAWALEDQRDNEKFGFIFEVRTMPRFWSVRPGRKQEVEEGIADSLAVAFGSVDV